MVSGKRRPRNRRFSELTGVLSRNMSKRKIKVHSPKHPLFWIKSKEENWEGRRERRRLLKGKRNQRRDMLGRNLNGGRGEREAGEPRLSDWSKERRRTKGRRGEKHPRVPAGTPQEPLHKEERGPFSKKPLHFFFYSLISQKGFLRGEKPAVFNELQKFKDSF